MIYATGDTHGNFLRLEPQYFPEQGLMTRDDYLLVLGDFGGIWDGSAKEHKTLDKLESLPFTVLWIDGNHENYDKIRHIPVEEWHGGWVQRIRPHVIHLMRGQIFELQGSTFFTMGGAASHDIEDGVLNPNASDFKEQYWIMRRMGARFRVNHRSWWKEELPATAEYEEALNNLNRVDWKVDYVLTHCAPSGIVNLISSGRYVPDQLTNFLDRVGMRLQFHYWLFGHYHDNQQIDEKHIMLYEQIVRVL